jgi:hypothetical protein
VFYLRFSLRYGASGFDAVVTDGRSLAETPSDPETDASLRRCFERSDDAVRANSAERGARVERRRSVGVGTPLPGSGAGVVTP